MTESNWCYINSSKTLPAANQVRLRDTSGPKLLDTFDCKTLPALKVLDISGPKVFWQVRPRNKFTNETMPTKKCLDKSSPEIFFKLSKPVLLSFFISSNFKHPRQVQPRHISGIETFLPLKFFSECIELQRIFLNLTQFLRISRNFQSLGNFQWIETGNPLEVIPKI